jgi:hypothetical protein
MFWLGRIAGLILGFYLGVIGISILVAGKEQHD